MDSEGTSSKRRNVIFIKIDYGTSWRFFPITHAFFSSDPLRHVFAQRKYHDNISFSAVLVSVMRTEVRAPFFIMMGLWIAKWASIGLSGWRDEWLTDF
jgi:hypothetical protein